MRGFCRIGLSAKSAHKLTGIKTSLAEDTLYVDGLTGLCGEIYDGLNGVEKENGACCDNHKG